MKKILKYISIGVISSLSISLIIVSIAKETKNTNSEQDTLYTYLESSDDTQFESNLGLASEQPILNENNERIGKRLYVDSSKELLNKDSILEFYNYIKSTNISYDEIVVSIGDNEAILASLKYMQVWKCDINENMELTKKEKLY